MSLRHFHDNRRIAINITILIRNGWSPRWLHYPVIHIRKIVYHSTRFVWNTKVALRTKILLNYIDVSVEYAITMFMVKNRTRLYNADALDVLWRRSVRISDTFFRDFSLSALKNDGILPCLGYSWFHINPLHLSFVVIFGADMVVKSKEIHDRRVS